MVLQDLSWIEIIGGGLTGLGSLAGLILAFLKVLESLNKKPKLKGEIIKVKVTTKREFEATGIDPYSGIAETEPVDYTTFEVDLKIWNKSNHTAKVRDVVLVANLYKNKKSREVKVQSNEIIENTIIEGVWHPNQLTFIEQGFFKSEEKTINVIVYFVNHKEIKFTYDLLKWDIKFVDDTVPNYEEDLA